MKNRNSKTCDKMNPVGDLDDPMTTHDISQRDLTYTGAKATVHLFHTIVHNYYLCSFVFSFIRCTSNTFSLKGEFSLSNTKKKKPCDFKNEPRADLGK